MMKKGSILKQRDITDCGAACLASVSAHYELRVPISRIRQIAYTDKKGTNALGMIEAAQNLGFTAKGVKGEYSSLLKIPLPAIAHVVIDGKLHHYVVIYKANDSFVEVMDPGKGTLEKISSSEFKEIWSGVLILMMPDSDFKKGDYTTSVRSRLLFLLNPHKATLFQVMTGAIIYTLLGLSSSIYVQKIVDHVIVNGNGNLLNLLSVIMITLLFIQISINVFKSMFVLKTGQQIDARLILGYYKHLLKLPQQFFDTMRTGEIISRINDAVKIRAFINDVGIDLLVNVFVIFFAFGLMFTYYWKLALVVLLVVPVYTLIYWITNKLNKKTERKVMESAAELESQLVESITSARTIKSFGLENYANVRTEVRFISLLERVYVSARNSIFSGNATEFSSRLFTIILLWVGTGYVLQTEISPGELLSFYALIGYFTGPVSSLIGANKTVQNAMIAADRLFEIMDLETDESADKIKLESNHLPGDIKVSGVSFRYGSRKDVFEDFDLVIPKGKVTALIGESGSGKTTLISLLQNLYPIQKGKIIYGDYDIKYIHPDSIQSVMAIVPQKVDLFSGNVLENIAIGDFSPDMSKVLEICKQLNILEFIESLPNGFQTYLGENGASLSGGQKQRLAIARALYREPDFLILDEATSALDASSEEYVMKTIQWMKGRQKTVLLITHRLATASRADKIVVLNNGKVEEEGNYAELMAAKGKYYRLWAKQLPVEFRPVLK